MPHASVKNSVSYCLVFMGDLEKLEIMFQRGLWAAFSQAETFFLSLYSNVRQTPRKGEKHGSGLAEVTLKSLFDLLDTKLADRQAGRHWVYWEFTGS